MDLDREAREGISDAGYGRRSAEKESAPRGWTTRASALAAVAAVSLFAFVWSRLHGKPARALEPFQYRDYKAAAAAFAFQNGRLPRFIPRLSLTITGAADRRTGETWVTLAVPVDAIPALTARFRKLGAAEVALLRIRGPGTAWWPAGLTGAVATPPWVVYETGGVLAGAGRTIRELAAFDRANGRACLWREAAVQRGR